MGMSADDNIQLRHCLCKKFILGFLRIFTGSTVGEADNHIHIFFFLYGCHSLLHRLDWIFKLKRAGWCTGKGILAEYSKQCDFYTALLDDFIILYTIMIKGIF